MPRREPKRKGQTPRFRSLLKPKKPPPTSWKARAAMDVQTDRAGRWGSRKAKLQA